MRTHTWIATATSSSKRRMTARSSLLAELSGRFVHLLATGALVVACVCSVSVHAQSLPNMTRGPNVTSSANVGTEAQVSVVVDSNSASVTFSVASGAGTITSTGQAPAGNGVTFSARVAITNSAAPIVVNADCSFSIFGCSPSRLTFVITGIDPQAEVQGALRSFSALGRTGADTAQAQMSNIQNRIKQRRGGLGGGISLYGASLSDGRQTLSGVALQSLLHAFDGKGAQAVPRNGNWAALFDNSARPGRHAGDVVSYLATPDVKSPDEEASDRLGIFVNGQGIIGTQDTTSGQTGYRAKSAALTAGVDYRFIDSFIFGAAVGYTRARSDFDAAIGQAKTQGFSFSLFGSYAHKNGFYIDSIANFGWNFYDTDRRAANGLVANSDTRGNQGGVSITTGYDINRGPLSFGPYLRASYIRAKVNDLTETGGAELNLHADSQSILSLTTAVGMQASYAISTSWGVLSPNVKLEWEHQYRDNSRVLNGVLVADPGQAYSVLTDNPDRNYFNVGLGLAAQFAQGRAAFVSYETVVGRSNTSNNAVTLGVRMEF